MSLQTFLKLFHFPKFVFLSSIINIHIILYVNLILRTDIPYNQHHGFEWSKMLNEICLCHRDIKNSICKYSISINYVSYLGIDTWNVIKKLYNVIHNIIQPSNIFDYFLSSSLTCHILCIDGMLIIVKNFLSKSG